MSSSLLFTSVTRDFWGQDNPNPNPCKAKFTILRTNYSVGIVVTNKQQGHCHARQEEEKLYDHIALFPHPQSSDIATSRNVQMSASTLSNECLSRRTNFAVLATKYHAGY